MLHFPQQEHYRRRMDEMNGVGTFSGPMEMPAPAAIPASPNLPTPAEPKPLADPVLEALGALEIADEALNAKRLQLIALRADMNREIRELLESQTAETREKLIQQHRDCRKRGVEAEQALQTVLDKITDATSEMNRSAEKLNEAVASLRAVRLDRSGLHRFASDEEIAAADEAIAKAEKRVDKFEAQKASAMQHRNFLIFTDLPAAQKRVADIANELTRLELILSGRDKYVDLEIGIMGPVGSPEPYAA